MASKLTDRQQQILDLIRQTVARTGFPPTRAEIAQALGFRSPNAAEDHLKRLWPARAPSSSRPVPPAASA